jgi:2,4-dienoyl-CoA reductase-like NADH-dependent reductase (Old Yellow Enzyme family)/thioredoxin reductase
MAVVSVDGNEALRGSAFQNLLKPLRIGPMVLRNRLMVPPHGGRIGNLWGTEAEAERNVAYWAARAQGGAAWTCGVSAHIGNSVIPGFEPTGVGAMTVGHFRQPFYKERVGAYARAVRGAGAMASVQMVMQGGTPHGPSSAMSAPIVNVVPHVLDADEISHIVSEYRFAAAETAQTGVDGIEVHLNHDDILEWFISPATNLRDDEYGGSMDNRLRLPLEILSAIRDEVGRDLAVGVRLNLYQAIPHGYDAEAGIAHAQRIEATGLVDYLNVVIGTAWGNPSYIQPHLFEPGQWAESVGVLKRAVSLPVVHAGRVTTPELAESILAAGHADVIGMARGHIADPDILQKAVSGRSAEIRPCVGGNECISRHYVEELPFACAVNPDPIGSHVSPVEPPSPRTLLVIGGGPAGMELAASAAERGHVVELWEAQDVLGGQLRLATAAPGYLDFERYLEWQERRLARVGVTVRLSCTASEAQVRKHGAAVLAIATGARARIPPIPGVELPFVHDARAVLAGKDLQGSNVVVIAQDDHMAPLALADLLADRGHRVTVLYASVMPAPLLSRYMIGSILGRLDAKGVELRCTSDVAEIGEGRVVVRHVFSDRLETITDVDAVVLACGAVANDGVYYELKTKFPEVHVLGDAYAPRRLVFAIKQAHALSLTI